MTYLYHCEQDDWFLEEFKDVSWRPLFVSSVPLSGGFGASVAIHSTDSKVVLQFN